MKHVIKFTVNGNEKEVAVDSWRTLNEVLQRPTAAISVAASNPCLFQDGGARLS